MSDTNQCNGPYVRTLNSDLREARCLVLEPDKDDAKIRTFLKYTSLNNDIEFLALSYTWEPPCLAEIRENKWVSDGQTPLSYYPVKIKVNGFDFEITANLLYALLRLRDSGTQIFCWIDAICIDQSNSTERAEQVRIMGDIYRKASAIKIWLGEEEGDTDSEVAIVLLMHLVKTFEDWTETDIGQAVTNGPEVEGNEDQPLAAFNPFRTVLSVWTSQIDFFALGVRCDNRAWVSVARLLQRSWFDRVWTLQERALAKNAAVLVGSRSISWTDLQLAMWLIIAHDNWGMRVSRSRVLPGRQYLRVSDSDVAYSQMTLLQLVNRARRRSCKDPRDHIFAVLGMAEECVSTGVNKFSRMVNYETLSVTDLYKEFSRFWIQDQLSLEILRSCFLCRTGINNLPSWVPDWSVPQFCPPLPPMMYKASQNTTVQVQHEEASNEISLSGVIIDRIKKLCPCLELKGVKNILELDSERFPDVFRRMIDPYIAVDAAVCGGQADVAPVMEWVATVQQLQWDQPYITGESMREAYWRSLLIDDNPNATSLQDRRVPKDVNVCSIFDVWTKRQPVPSEFEPDQADEEVRYDNYTRPWFEKLDSSLPLRRFYVTKNGYMGLALQEALEEDYVCVFLGADVPFVLRDFGDYYSIVGETYLHGFMDGRALETGNRVEKLSIQ